MLTERIEHLFSFSNRPMQTGNGESLRGTTGHWWNSRRVGVTSRSNPDEVILLQLLMLIFHPKQLSFIWKERESGSRECEA